MLTHGLLIIDKPTGVTSHDVVDHVRHRTGERCVGHAGTLDPFATGLLLVAVGRDTTKHLNEYVGLDKEYLATAVLGTSSTTDDCDGVLTPHQDVTQPSREKIEEVLATFLGEHDQVVPSYAAKKVNGMKLYEYARKGLLVPRVTNHITIYDISLVSYEWPLVTFYVSCSSGTYIRALARDLGSILATGAYLSALRRTKVGTFDVEHAQKIADI